MDLIESDQSIGPDQTADQNNQQVSNTSDNAQDLTKPEIAFDTNYPVPKRYAHHGKRRRSITKELFRCPYTDMISRTPLVCGHLLWRNKIPELRAHLLEHLKVEEIDKMDDSQVLAWYTDAKRIFLEGIPEDDDEDNLDEDESEEDGE